MLQVVFPFMVALTAPNAPVRPADCIAPTKNLMPPPDYDDIACFPSPDGQKRAVVHHGRILVKTDSRVWRIGTTDYGHLIWNPASTGFAIEDSGGSGQTSFFSYVDVARLPPRRILALRSSAVRVYAARFRCKGPNFYAHAWFDRWEQDGRVRLRVVEGVHSEGCHHSDPEGVSIVIVGDPATGRIDQVVSQRQLGAAKSP